MIKKYGNEKFARSLKTEFRLRRESDCFRWYLCRARRSFESLSGGKGRGQGNSLGRRRQWAERPTWKRYGRGSRSRCRRESNTSHQEQQDEREEGNQFFQSLQRVIEIPQQAQTVEREPGGDDLDNIGLLCDDLCQPAGGDHLHTGSQLLAKTIDHALHHTDITKQ